MTSKCDKTFLINTLENQKYVNNAQDIKFILNPVNNIPLFASQNTHF